MWMLPEETIMALKSEMASVGVYHAPEQPTVTSTVPTRMNALFDIVPVLKTPLTPLCAAPTAWQYNESNDRFKRFCTLED
jgi:hypothetical protein